MTAQIADTFTLEVGKTYRSLKGAIVTITHTATLKLLGTTYDSALVVFIGSNQKNYLCDGTERVVGNKDTSAVATGLDPLKEEVVMTSAKPNPLKLQLGKTYLSSKNALVGISHILPMKIPERSTEDTTLYFGGGGDIYFEDGSVYKSLFSEDPLVKEYTPSNFTSQESASFSYDDAAQRARGLIDACKEAGLKVSITITL